ncbi:hypothetical protein QCA50_006219 [Cerrena zonata]|uniref:Uncharacterized protein n=1 Tax=Cerrena zonata TaxID=2478898 RepID=A0AAW0GCM6_9APHY
MYVETAGGVHSPTLSGTTQLDSYRPLFLPTILIGDSRLGGISATISSYESLALRGHIVDSILLFRDEYYRNWEYLDPYFAGKGVKVHTIDPPPPKVADYHENLTTTEKYYQDIVPSGGQGAIFDAIKHLDSCHKSRLEELESMPRRTLESVWWPFVQHAHYVEDKDVAVIDSALGDAFTVYNGNQPQSASPSLLEPQFDGSASWWTQAVGHAQPSLTLAAARASGRYGHTMFPKLFIYLLSNWPKLSSKTDLERDGLQELSSRMMDLPEWKLLSRWHFVRSALENRVVCRRARRGLTEGILVFLV